MHDRMGTVNDNSRLVVRATSKGEAVRVDSQHGRLPYPSNVKVARTVSINSEPEISMGVGLHRIGAQVRRCAGVW